MRAGRVDAPHYSLSRDDRRHDERDGPRHPARRLSSKGVGGDGNKASPSKLLAQVDLALPESKKLCSIGTDGPCQEPAKIFLRDALNPPGSQSAGWQMTG